MSGNSNTSFKIGDVIARKDMLIIRYRIVGENKFFKDAWDVVPAVKLKGMNTPIDEEEMIEKGYGKERHSSGGMVFKDDDRWVKIEV